MSRHDKIGAAVLGLLLFSGLFYFIYTTMKNPLPPEFGDEEYFSDELGEDFEEEAGPVEGETTEAEAAPVPAEPEAAPAAKP